jgi:hypothetical protein
LEDLELLPQDASEDPEASLQALELIVIQFFYVITRTSRKAISRVAKYFIQVALHPDRFRAPEDDCSNA